MLQLYKQLDIDEALAPQSLASASATGTYLPANMVRRMLFTLITGAIAAAGTVKIELLQATDAAGTGSKSVPNASATITASVAMTAGLAFVELNTESLDNQNGFNYVAAKVTTTATVLVGVTCHGGGNRYTPDITANAYTAV